MSESHVLRTSDPGIAGYYALGTVPTLKWTMGYTSGMGALDKRIFSGLAILSALLFVVFGAMVAGKSDLTSDDNTIALYLLTIAGLLAAVYSFSMIQTADSFARKLSAVLIIVAGIMFAVSGFLGGNAATVLAAAGVVAGIGLVLDMLALWVSRVYGAMYVSAVLAAVDLVMGAMCLVKGYSGTYALAIALAFAVWLVISAFVTGFIKIESVVKTREVVEAARSQKDGVKPQAHNKKATPKAKKPEPKKAEEPVAEEKPAEEPKKVRTVQLPKTPAAEAAIKQSQAGAVTKDAGEKPAEEPKKEQKPPAKAMGDFMQKLMTSEAAHKATARPQPPVDEPVVKEEPKAEEPVKEVPSETPAEPVVEEKPAEEPKAEESVKKEPEEQPRIQPAEPMASVISEPVVEKETSEVFHTPEPNWGIVTRDSSSEDGSEDKPAKTLKPKAEEPVPEEVPAEEPVVEEKPEEVPAETPAEPVVEEKPAEESVKEEPVQEPVETPVEEPKAEEPVPEEVPAEEPKAETPAEPVVEEKSAEESVKEEPVQETSVEEVPAEIPAEPVPSVIAEPVVEKETSEEFHVSEPNWGTVTDDSSAEPQEEDAYTDNSPEALVRRAAWNKGLRCRRNYGDANIPVAFVKGKVAVYVGDADADTSGDDALRAEGWTVLRYNAADITDGKDQGEEIAAAVKENTKAVKKKKAKK